MLKALILNSGMGSRMGEITREHPKCMTRLSENDTIISRQLRLLCHAGITEAVITTGYYDEVLRGYCGSLSLPIKLTFVPNPLYQSTNYIYSINCAAGQLVDCDILLMHGDLVFDEKVLENVLAFEGSCMTVSSTRPLPQKDFKAVVTDGRITAVGIEFFDSALAAQPLYKLKSGDWLLWQEEISRFCSRGEVGCYAENAFNRISDKCCIYPLDTADMLCSEVDTPQDLQAVSAALAAGNGEHNAADNH